MVGTIDALWQDLRELGTPGPRARLCTMATLAVVLAVVAAEGLHIDDPWWAAISAFSSTQASLPASLARGALRIVGTAIGAAIGFLMAPFLAYDHLLGCLMLLGVTTASSLGAIVSDHSYAWLFLGITATLVALGAMTEPHLAVDMAVSRIVEVTLGTGSAIAVSLLLASDAAPARQRAPGWSDLLGSQWQAVLHAWRTGISVMAIPIVWSLFNLPSASQMAISVAAVTAVPSFSNDMQETARVVLQRSLNRLFGCCLGGGFAIAVLAVLQTPDFLLWLVVLGLGIWIGVHLQGSTRGLSYVGTQATIAFILTVIQGDGPPSSLLPALDRLGGMIGGLTILLIVTALVWPDPDPLVDRRPPQPGHAG